MASKLRKSLTNLNNSLADNEEILHGKLGTVIGGQTTVSVPNRAAFVYVRLRSNQSELIQAFNEKVAQKYDLPVILKRVGNRYEVVGRDAEAYTDWQNDDPYVAKHAEQHLFDKDAGNVGGDTAWIHQQQFLPGLVAPLGDNGAQNVFIYPYSLRDLNGNWKFTGNTGTISLTQYNPSSGATIVLISIDSVSGNPYILANTGTYAPIGLTGTSQLLPYIPFSNDPRYIPSSIVKLVSGTSAIGWESIYDVRQFLPTTTTGSSGDGSISGLTGNRVVITNPSGTVTTDDVSPLEWDYANKVLSLGADPNDVLGGTLQDSFSITGRSGTSPSLFQWAFGSTVAGFITFVKARGTRLFPASLLSGDVLGRIRTRGYTASGSLTQTRTEVRFVTEADWQPGSAPAGMEFYTTPSGTETLTKAMRIDSNQKITASISGFAHHKSIPILIIDNDERMILLQSVEINDLTVEPDGVLLVE